MKKLEDLMITKINNIKLELEDNDASKAKLIYDVILKENINDNGMKAKIRIPLDMSKTSVTKDTYEGHSYTQTSPRTAQFDMTGEIEYEIEESVREMLIKECEEFKAGIDNISELEVYRTARRELKNGYVQLSNFCPTDFEYLKDFEENCDGESCYDCWRRALREENEDE